MERALDESLAGGRVRLLSTGLHVPSRARARGIPELERLCRVGGAAAARFTVTHMRDYSFRLPDAVEEQLELARRTGCRLPIFAISGRRTRDHWGLQAPALEKDRACAGGGDGRGLRLLPLPVRARPKCSRQLLRPQGALEGGLTGPDGDGWRDPAERHASDA